MFRHLVENGMTYWQHWRHALGMWLRIEIAQCKLFIHAFYPDWFEHDATDTWFDVLYEHYGSLKKSS